MLIFGCTLESAEAKSEPQSRNSCIIALHMPGSLLDHTQNHTNELLDAVYIAAHLMGLSGDDSVEVILLNTHNVQGHARDL